MGQLLSSTKILSYNDAIARLPQQDLERLKKGWKVLTTSNSRGVVEKKTFIKEVLGSHIPPQLADRIFFCFDLSGNGFLNYKDFISGMTIFMRGTSEEKMQFVFAIFDISKSKKISPDDMAAILKEDIIDPINKNSIESIVEQCFQKYDGDEDGKLTFQELRTWATENKNLTALLSWIFSEENFSPISNEGSEEKIQLLSSGEIRSADLRSSKSLSTFTQFDEKEVKDLERTFKELQKKSPSGKLDKETLGSIFYPPLSKLLLDRIFSSFDDNLDGYIDAREFVVGMSLLCRGDEQKKLNFWFNIFDIDGDSQLSRAEMLSMVSSLWKSQSLKMDIKNSLEIEINSGEDLMMIENNNNNENRSNNIIHDSRSQLTSSFDDQDYLRMEKLVESAFEEFGIPLESKISFQQFQDWFKKTQIAIEFLDAIKRMSNVVLGLKPSSLDDEREIIKELSDKKMIAGDIYYVTSFKWISLWKDSVGFDDGEKKTQIEVGPIDNAKLLDRKIKNKLRQNLMENHDYVLLSEGAWNVLWNWYGGGPALSRQVINLGDENKPFVELYPYHLKVYMIKSTVIQTPVRVLLDYSISKKDTLIEMKKDLCKRLTIDDLENVRIWNYYNESKPTVLENHLASTLEDAKIVNAQKIIVEVKTEEGFWPLENFSTASEQLASQPGLVGLNNLGNTCFLNSAIQSLSNTRQLTEYFLTNRYRADINKSNRLGMQGEVAKSYASLIKKLWQGDGKDKILASYAPRDFKRTIGRFAPQFSGGQQHDAQELLDFLLNGLHEDLNLVKEKPYVENPNNDGVPDEELAKLFWEGYLRRNQSVIVDLFQGQLKSSLICNQCHYNSVTFDPFTFLSVPLPMEEICLFEIIVHLYDEKQIPIKYSVRISSEALVFEIKDSISKLCQLKPKQILLCEVQRHYVFRELGDLARIKSIQSQILHAYQITSKSEAIIENEKKGKKKKKGGGVVIRHIPFLHRYLQPLSVYFFAPYKAILFGVPVVISIRNQTTVRDLYSALGKQLSRYIKFIDQSNNDNNNAENNQNWKKRFPFRLKFVSKNGETCGICSWNKFCLGCELIDDLQLQRISSHTTFAIEWDYHLLSTHFDSSLAKASIDHESIEENKRIMEQPISLTDCLNLFTVEEKLSKDEAWYCPKCKDFQSAVKKMSLWKLPPILVIHLKRFHFNGHNFQKISKLVDFPLKNLNLSDYSEQNSNLNQTYHLHSVLNHMGGLGRGHYITHAKNNNKWFTFDDSRVYEIEKEKVSTKSAYVLFYSLANIDDIEIFSKLEGDPNSLLESSEHNSPSSVCNIM